jgi:hypothetical protein
MFKTTERPHCHAQRSTLLVQVWCLKGLPESNAFSTAWDGKSCICLKLAILLHLKPSAPSFVCKCVPEFGVSGVIVYTPFIIYLYTMCATVHHNLLWKGLVLTANPLGQPGSCYKALTPFKSASNMQGQETPTHKFESSAACLSLQTRCESNCGQYVVCHLFKFVGSTFVQL